MRRITQQIKNSRVIVGGHRGPRRALLRYFGGKWALAPWIIQFLPTHHTYVEPYGGAASVLLQKPRSPVEVYNDLDGDVVSLFRVIQAPETCSALIRALRRTPYSREVYEEAFTPARSDLTRAIKTAVRFHMAVHPTMAYGDRPVSFAHSIHKNGGYSRARSWAAYPRSLAGVRDRLSAVIIANGPALDVIRAQDAPMTLFYVDPPYVPESRTDAAYRYELAGQDHAELLDTLNSIAGMAIVSGYPSAAYDRALRRWHRVEKATRAQGSRKPRTEVLWVSPRAYKSMTSEQRKPLRVAAGSLPVRNKIARG